MQSINKAVTSSTVLWIKWVSENTDPDNYWMLGSSTTRVYALTSADGTTWSEATVEPYCIVAEDEKDWLPIFFDYKYATYAVVSRKGSNPRIFIQGWRGKATASADVDGLNDSSQSFPVNGLIDCYVHIYAGTGSLQQKTVFKVTSNTSTKVFFDTNSTVSFDATTEYVISGKNYWNELTGWGLTGVCSDVLEYNGVLYFALGKGISIRKVQWTASAGYAYRNDGSNTATYMQIVREPSSTQFWIANNDPPSVAKAAIVAYASDMTFGSALQFDDYKYGRITNLGEYGDSTRVLWVMREYLPFLVDASNKIERFPIDTLSVFAAPHNGKASLADNIYWYTTFGSGIYRWYNRDLKDYGPNISEGLPIEAQGYCTVLKAYPGCLYAVYTPYDSENGFSTIYVHNGTGWAELYRSARAGTTIHDIHFQTILGQENRLLIFNDNDIIIHPMPIRTIAPDRDPT